MIFEADHFTTNQDIMADYMNLLMDADKFEEALEARKKLTKHLIKTKEIDH